MSLSFSKVVGILLIPRAILIIQDVLVIPGGGGYCKLILLLGSCFRSNFSDDILKIISVDSFYCIINIIVIWNQIIGPLNLKLKTAC